MFGRFFFWTVLLTVAFGICMHFSIEIPYFGKWIGTLPGDLILKKKDIMIYFPITSAAIISFFWSMILTAIFGRK